jgi:hypothetical protein
MDNTQRNLLGGFGVALVLGGIAWLGYFPSTSFWVRAGPAAAMVLVGLGMFTVAFKRRETGWMSKRRGKRHLKRNDSGRVTPPAVPKSAPQRHRSSFIHFGGGGKISGVTLTRNLAIGTDDFISSDEAVELTDSKIEENLHIPPPSEEPPKQ